MKLRAVLLHQQANMSANLIWGPPLTSESKQQLIQSLENLRKKEYWASPFPEGDGIAFSHKTYEPDSALRDLIACFEWLEIIVPSHSADEAIGQLHAGRKVRVRYLVPADKLLQWPALIQLGPYKIHRPVVPGERPAVDHPWHEYLLDIAGADVDPDWDPQSAPLGTLARLLAYPLIEGETEVDGRLLFPVGAGTTEDEPLVLQITDHADRVLDILRHNYCHYKTPHYTPNQAGVLSDWGFRAAFVMPDAADIPERLVVAKGQVFEANNVWLGLEVDSHPGCEAGQMATIAAGIVANVVEERARAALRMRGQSFFLLNDEMKFLSLVFSADACALVEKKTGLAQRLHVAAFASFGRKENFENHLQVFKKLYKFRNGIVHQGKSFGELGITAKECLIMMDNILCCCIDAAMQEGWTTKAEVKHAIDARLLSFGVPNLTPAEDVDEETGASFNI